MTTLHFALVKKYIFALLFTCIFTALPSSFFPTLANEQANAKENATSENATSENATSENATSENATSENATSEIDQPKNGKLDASTTRKIMDEHGSDLLIIDVRTEKEFAQGHIPEAVLIPLNVFSRSLGKVPTDKPILIVCRSGARAESAFKILRGARPTQKSMWFFDGYPQYGEDNYYELNDQERFYR